MTSLPLKAMRVTINHVGDDGSTFSKTIAMQMDHSLSKCKDTAKLWITKIRKDIEMQKKLTLFFHVGSGLLFSDATTIREACAAVNAKCGTKYGEPSKSKSGKIKMGKALELQFAELVLPNLVAAASQSQSSSSDSSGASLSSQSTTAATVTSTAVKPSSPRTGGDHSLETSYSKSDASGAGDASSETSPATSTSVHASSAAPAGGDELDSARKSIDIADEPLASDKSKEWQQQSQQSSSDAASDAPMASEQAGSGNSGSDSSRSGGSGSRPSTGVDTSTVPSMPMAIQASHTPTTPDTAAVADATMAAALDGALDTVVDADGDGGDAESENKIDSAQTGADSSSKPDSPIDKYSSAAKSIGGGPVMTRARSQRRMVPTTPVSDGDSAAEAIPESSEVVVSGKSGFPLSVSEVAMESISGVPAESPVFLALMFMEYEKRLSSMGQLMDDVESLKHREEELMQQVREYKSQVDHLTSVVNDRGASTEPKQLDADIGLAPDETETKAASQLGLRKVKTSRRESRVQVVQLKIDAELQRGRNPKAVVPYADDSPFWWRRLRDHHARVKRLSDRLNTLCTMMEEGCVLLDKFSKQCADIFHSVKESWQDCEGELSSDILSLNSQFNELGEEFAHMSNASQQLSVTFRAVLITPFLEFVNTQWTMVSSSYKAVKSHGLEYEKALKELLRAPKKLAPDPPGTGGSLTPDSAMKTDGTDDDGTRKSWSIGSDSSTSKAGSSGSSSSGSSSTTTASSFMGVWKSLTTKGGGKSKKKSLMSYSQQMTVREYNLLLVKVAQRRREYELKRFQHCQLINQVMHRHRYDLIVSICACFSGFETFFHVGYEGALAHKAFMRSIQRGVMTRMDAEDEKDAGTLKKERKLDENLSYGIAAAQSGKEVDNLHKSEFDDHCGKSVRSLTVTAEPVKPLMKAPAAKFPSKSAPIDGVVDTMKRMPSESADLDGSTAPETAPKLPTIGSVSSVTSERNSLEIADASLSEIPEDLKKTTSLSSAKSDPYDVDSWSGYLWKQSTNVLKDWKRRWFVMDQGELAYYRSKDKMDRVLMVNTMLSKVRDKYDSELRFVFEIVTPTQRIYTLQCENEADYVAWTSVLRNQPARMLRRNTMEGGAFGSSRKPRPSVVESRRRKNDLVSKIQAMNPECCDCGKPMPEWLSINTGALICISCSGVHRSLGTHVSKVRSLMLDDISEVTLECIAEIGNSTLNEILEFNILSDYEKCSEESTMNDRERFIKAKFAFRMFVDTDRVKAKTFGEWNADLWHASSENDLIGILRCIFFGANVDSTDPENAGRSALHIAAMNGHTCAIELLLQNGANFDLRDDTGKSIRDLVQESGDAGAAHQVLTILDTHDPSYGKTSYAGSESGKDDSDSGEEFSMDLP